MIDQSSDVRIYPRYPASAVPAITGVRLTPGDAVDLVNISRSGLLVEGRTRFVPGTRVAIHFEGSFQPSTVKGRIVHCQVSSISGGALSYQSGLQFDSRLDINPGDKPSAVEPPPPSAAAAVPVPSTPRAAVNRW